MNIYKIVCRTTGLTYVGSTEKTIEKRLEKHESDKIYWDRGTTTRGYVTSYKVLESNDYYIELIEVCDEEERYVREGFYIKSIGSVNKINVGKTKKQTDNEYYQTHKKEISVQQSQYRDHHKDKISVVQRQYRQGNKDKISVVKRQYNQTHKDKIKEQTKKYYESHKEDIIAKQRMKITCDCGAIVSHCNTIRHCNTKKHLDLIVSLKMISDNEETE
jgi:hypothetical protein